jgi:hypothetical protein
VRPERISSPMIITAAAMRSALANMGDPSYSAIFTLN